MIHTARLCIRPFREQDAQSLFEYLSDPIVYRFEPGTPITLEEAHAVALERSQTTSFWAVELEKTQKLIGHLYFQQSSSKEFLTWELGYIFNPAYQNQGYASEAAGALIRYGFEHWEIHRVIAYCSPENTASWKVMEKIGMRREGFFRKNIFFYRAEDGSPIWLDTYEYAILKEEVLSNEKLG
jgi:RimJ/RimL family protein N-acetyltransferase